MVEGGRVKSGALLRLRLVWRVLSRRRVLVFSDVGSGVECGCCGSWSGVALVHTVGVLAHMTMEAASAAAVADGYSVPTITAADLEAAEAVADLLKGVGGTDGSQG